MRWYDYALAGAVGTLGGVFVARWITRRAQALGERLGTWTLFQRSKANARGREMAALTMLIEICQDYQRQGLNPADQPLAQAAYHRLVRIAEDNDLLGLWDGKTRPYRIEDGQVIVG